MITYENRKHISINLILTIIHFIIAQKQIYFLKKASNLGNDIFVQKLSKQRTQKALPLWLVRLFCYLNITIGKSM